MDIALSRAKAQTRLLFLSPHVLGKFDEVDLYMWGLDGDVEALLSQAIANGLLPKQRCITPQVLRRWAKLLGLKTERGRYGYTQDEISQLIDYYRAVHMMRILSQEGYVEEVVKKGLTLDKYLILKKYKPS